MEKRLNFKINKRKGIAALPLILMIGGLIGEIIVALLVSNFFLTQSESGLRASSKAFLAAQSGYQDAFMKIIRDKSFEESYTLTFDDSSVDVTVCKNAPDPVCVGDDKDKITLIGRAGNKTRKFEAILDVNQVTGESLLNSFNEVPI